MAISSARNSSIRAFDKFRGVNIPTSVPMEYLVIGGGGGGGSGDQTNAQASGGGGAGGYRCSVVGELTGGNGTAEPTFLLFNPVTITVGAGGTFGARGNNSQFASIISLGGGADSGKPDGFSSPRTTFGGSGAGGGFGESSLGISYLSGLNVNNPVQGFLGGNGGTGGSNNSSAGGGGGAGQAGATPTSSVTGGNGGNGLASAITLTSVTRSGGGGGQASRDTNVGLVRGIGGAGGGGNGSLNLAGQGDGGVGGAGAVNTGSGGGGGVTGGAGGSGVVIVRYPATNSNLIVGSGLVIDNGSGGNVSGAGVALAPSFSNATWKVYMFKSGTGTVSF